MVLLTLHAAREENLEVGDVFLGPTELGRSHHKKGKGGGGEGGDHVGPQRLRGKENGKELPGRDETSPGVP